MFASLYPWYEKISEPIFRRGGSSGIQFRSSCTTAFTFSNWIILYCRLIPVYFGYLKKYVRYMFTMCTQKHIFSKSFLYLYEYNKLYGIASLFLLQWNPMGNLICLYMRSQISSFAQPKNLLLYNAGNTWKKHQCIVHKRVCPWALVIMGYTLTDRANSSLLCRENQPCITTTTNHNVIQKTCIDGAICMGPNAVKSISLRKERRRLYSLWGPTHLWLCCAAFAHKQSVQYGQQWMATSK